MALIKFHDSDLVGIYVPNEQWDEFCTYTKDKGIEFQTLGATNSTEREVFVDPRTDNLQLIKDFVDMELRDPTDYFCPRCGEISRLYIYAIVVVANLTFLRTDRTRGVLQTSNVNFNPIPGTPKPVVTKIQCLGCNYKGPCDHFTWWRAIKEAISVEVFPETLASGLTAIQRMAIDRMEELK